MHSECEPAGKRHSAYNYQAKNSGKDLIFQTRLRLARKLKIHIVNSSKVYSYLMDAQLGYIL